MKQFIKWLLLGALLSLIALKIITLFLVNPVDAASLPSPILEENICVALNYHRIRPKNLFYGLLERLTGSKELTTYTVYAEEFAAQMDKLIEEGVYFATPEDLKRFRESGEYPDKCVWISFDDADETLYEYAFPILKERQIPFTVFVIAGHVGEHDFNNLSLATWEELREIYASGLATFGSHTYDMHYLEDDRATFFDQSMHGKFEKDLKLSKAVLEEELGIPITSIAYPFGETNAKLTEIVKRSGFTDAYILSPHPISAYNDPYYQDRYLISQEVFDGVIIPWLEKDN